MPSQSDSDAAAAWVKAPAAQCSHAESEWWSKETVAVVTGGNRGIGFELVKQLAQKGITTVLTSRDVKRGEEATTKLLDQGLPVTYHQLDVASAESSQALAAWLQKEYGGVDILINNAAIADITDGSVLSIAEATFATNYYGVKNVTSSLFPLLRPSNAGARVVNLSTRGAQLSLVAKEALREALADVGNPNSEEAWESFLNEYMEDVKMKKQRAWVYFYNPNYILSKALMNAYTRLLASKVADRPAGQMIYVNCFCPGFTDTDMAKNFLKASKVVSLAPEAMAGIEPTHGPDVAAANAIWLALLPADKVPSGTFSGERSEVEF